MDNYDDVVHQLQEFLQGYGHEFRSGAGRRDLPLRVNTTKSVGFGTKGKYWYKLHTFRPQTGGELIRGSFGKYGSDKAERIEIDWKPINEEERKRLADERASLRAAADAARREEANLAAMNATELWRSAAREGKSDYLRKKGVAGEACRFLRDGSLVVPLLRYDWPRDQALRAVQRIKPDGSKLFTKGFSKHGCAVRLGEAEYGYVVLICEGYATGLSLRMSVNREFAVYVALDAGNLHHVVPIVRQLHPDSRILICADDDWRTIAPTAC